MAESSPESVIVREFDRRRRADPSFSVRRCARLVGLSSGAMSEILAGKRPLTLKSATKMAEGLALSPTQRRQLFSRLISPSPAAAPELSSEKRKLESERFRAISEWHYYAIVSLSEVKGSRFDPAWIARRLGITRSQASIALARLERLGLIRVEGNRYFSTEVGTTTSHNVASVALRRFHQQLLRKAEEAQHQLPVSERHLSTITFVASRHRIEEAQTRIRHFQRELCEFLEQGDRERVYTLAVQLFPLDKGEHDVGSE
jgi:uncharacterized protein (TIGR02147 family)